jgi:amino acid adenylation domain-containing protein
MSICQFLQVHSTKNPASIAIKDERDRLTYRQLDRRVNQLANYLRQRGIEPDVLVGIYTDRSIASASAILAVLLAGGAYVPLDPSYPQARSLSILAATKLQLVLTQQHLAADLESSGVDLFLLDAQWEEVATQSEQIAPAPTNPTDLAYVMYTSGSTGQPQGVEITIEQVTHYLQAVNAIVEIQPDDIYLLSASFAFSSSIRQLLLPLSQGAQVVITSKNTTTNLGSLLETIQNERITVFDTVASVWNYMLISLAELEPTQSSQLRDSQLRLAIFSGGLLTSQLVERVRSQFPQQSLQIVNIYGQTETIGVCAYPVPDNFSQTEGYAPVGTPYPHNRLYLLDEELAPVAVGKVGELHIAGKSLARGYLNNPQLNARKFIPNHLTDGQERLYKTGDLARYLPDGNLEIVGRQDFQVKIRGMRVEVEEIETVLMQHPDVRQAAVVGHRDNRQTAALVEEQQIVAYIVPDRESIDIPQLRAFLKTKLTDYALPSAFEILPALPLTPNHKLDRKRLPAPSRANTAVAAPRDEIELQLTQIWERALGVQPIGINDNFFELGGHSLIALQLFAKIEQSWHKRLSWGVLFASPTIAELAEIIRTEAVTTEWSPLVLLKSGRDRLPLFCIHALGGTLFNYYDLVKCIGTERPIYGLQSRGIDGKQQPIERVADIASYYIRSIQTIQPQGPYLLVGYSFGGIVAFEMARQLAACGERVDFLGLIDIRSPTLGKSRMSVKKWLSFHLDRLQKLHCQDRIKYFADKIFYRYSIKTKGDTEGYKEVMAKRLADFEMFEPELLNVLEANLQATKHYIPQTYSGRATLFWCEYQSLYIDRYPDLGWGEFVAGGVETVFVPGEHLSLLSEPHVRVLAEKLNLAIE